MFKTGVILLARDVTSYSIFIFQDRKDCVRVRYYTFSQIQVPVTSLWHSENINQFLAIPVRSIFNLINGKTDDNKSNFISAPFGIK